MNGKYLSKILLITIFTLISLSSLIISVTSIPNNYEISIYDAYPIYFWIFIILVFIISLFIIIFIGHNSDRNITAYKLAALFGSFLSIMIVLTLPYFRGYLLYSSGDIFSHFGFINDISFLGHISSNNIYPMMHIFIWEILSFTGLDFSLFSKFFPQLCITFYVIFILLLGKTINFTPAQYLLTTFLAIVPILGIEITREYVMPSFFAFATVPMLLYIIANLHVSKNKKPFTILLILMLIMYPVLHIEISLFILILLIALYLLSYFIKYWSGQNIILKNDVNYLHYIFIIGISFILWIMSFIVFQKILNRGKSQLFSDAGDSPALIVKDSLSSTYYDFADIIILIIKSYGSILIILSIAGLISIIYIIKFVIRKEQNPLYFILSVIYICFCGVAAVLFFKDWMFGLTFRYAKFSQLFAILIIGSYFGLKVQDNNKIKWKSVIYILLCVVVVLATLNLFPSPWINYSNRQIDNCRYVGSIFLLDNYDPSIPVIEMDVRLWNIMEAEYGYEKLLLDDRYQEGFQIKPRDHFGYDLEKYIGDLYNGQNYLAFSGHSKLWYPTIYPDNTDYWKFTPYDFKRLNVDPTLNKIYLTNNLEIYIIN